MWWVYYRVVEFHILQLRCHRKVEQALTGMLRPYYPPAFGLDPELNGLPGRRPAVGFYSSGRVPVLDDRSWLEWISSCVGVQKPVGFAYHAAPGSADAPRHLLRAGLGVFSTEGYAGTKVLGLRGLPSSRRPAAKWGWRPLSLPWRQRPCPGSGFLGPLAASCCEGRA